MFHTSVEMTDSVLHSVFQRRRSGRPVVRVRHSVHTAPPFKTPPWKFNLSTNPSLSGVSDKSYGNLKGLTSAFTRESSWKQNKKPKVSLGYARHSEKNNSSVQCMCFYDGKWTANVQEMFFWRKPCALIHTGRRFQVGTEVKCMLAQTCDVTLHVMFKQMI